MHTILWIGYVCLLWWGIHLSKSHDLLNLANVLLLVIIGLIYDNFIISIGKFIGEGNILKQLSFVRYMLHALFTPTLILFAWHICFKTGLAWTQKNFWKVVAYGLTIGLIMYELFVSVRGLELEAVWANGVLTYDSISHSFDPLMVILITIVLAIVGVILFVKFRFLWLFIGIFVMTLGSILAIWIKNFPITNVSELFLIVSLLLTEQFIISRNLNKSGGQT